MDGFGWIKAVIISPSSEKKQSCDKPIFIFICPHCTLPPANSPDSNRAVAANTGLTELSGTATAKSCLCWTEMDSGGAAAAAASIDGDGRADRSFGSNVPVAVAAVPFRWMAMAMARWCCCIVLCVSYL